MTYKGTIRNGAVVLEPPAELPEGAEVRVLLQTPSDSTTDREELGIWQALASLPDDACLEDFLERAYLFYKIERGVRQLDSGQGVPHEEAQKQFSEWLE